MQGNQLARLQKIEERMDALEAKQNKVQKLVLLLNATVTKLAKKQPAAAKATTQVDQYDEAEAGRASLEAHNRHTTNRGIR